MEDIYIMNVTVIIILAAGYLLLRMKSPKNPPHAVSPYVRKPPKHPVQLWDSTPKTDAGGSYMI